MLDLSLKAMQEGLDELNSYRVSTDDWNAEREDMNIFTGAGDYSLHGYDLSNGSGRRSQPNQNLFM